MMGFWDDSDISWTICKQSAPRSRQTSTPTLNFYRPDALPDAQLCQSTDGICNNNNLTENHQLRAAYRRDISRLPMQMWS